MGGRYAQNDERQRRLRNAWVALLEYRAVWYGALDGALLATVAALGVAGGLDASAPDLCRACTALIIALIMSQLVVLALSQPFTTLFSFVHAAVSLSLTCLSVVAQLAFVQISSADSSKLWLAQFSAACDLAVVGVTAVRILFDVSGVASAAGRRLALLRSSPLMTNFAPGDPDPGVIDASLLTTGGDPQQSMSPRGNGTDDAAMRSPAAEFQEEVELGFWDANGCAILPTPSSIRWTADDDEPISELARHSFL